MNGQTVIQFFLCASSPPPPISKRAILVKFFLITATSVFFNDTQTRHQARHKRRAWCEKKLNFFAIHQWERGWIFIFFYVAVTDEAEAAENQAQEKKYERITAQIMGGKFLWKSLFYIVDAYRKIMYTISIIANSSEAFFPTFHFVFSHSHRSLSAAAADQRFKLKMLISAEFIGIF